MASLVLGPMLRHVDDTSARLGGDVRRLRGVGARLGSQRTFQVGDRHYALVAVEGSRPRARTTPYEVRLDGERVWPPPGSTFPPPRIRTTAAGPTGAAGLRLLPVRLAAVDRRQRRAGTAPTRWTRTRGSSPAPRTPSGRTGCCCSATRCTRTRPRRITQERIRAAPGRLQAAGAAGGGLRRVRRAVRRVLGRPAGALAVRRPCRPSMIFDDHDVHDDWNTSRVWRAGCRRPSWWQERITGGLIAYWVYQHLGNLSPAALAEDELYRKVREADGDVGPLLHDFAAAADREADGAKGYRWSYRRDFGPVRLRGGRLPVRPDPGRGTGAMVGSRGRVRLDRGAGGPATTSTCWSARRCPGCCRGPCTTWSPGTRRCAPARGARGWRASARRCARPRISSTGRRSGRPSTGSPACCDEVGRAGRRTRHDLRAVRRRAPPVRRRGAVAVHSGQSGSTRSSPRRCTTPCR